MTARRIGILGAGIVAELYAKAFERGLDAKFAGIFDPNTDRANSFSNRLGGKVYLQRDEMLADSSIDAVVVLSPNANHVDDALASLAARKHVLIEKPVAERHSQIRDLENAAAGAGRICMPAHNYIYMDRVIRMRRLIADGRLGTLASLWILYNIHHPEAIAARYGGVLREVAVHHAYSLLYLAGRPVSVSAQATRLHYDVLEAEDQVMLTCRLANGGLANLWVSFAASDHTSDPWTVIYKALGTKGGATFSWNDAIVEDDGGPAWGIANYVDSFHTEMTYFLKAMNGSTAPLSSLADASDALAIIEAAERSMANDGISEPVRYQHENANENLGRSI